MMTDDWWLMTDAWWLMTDAWWLMHDDWWLMHDDWWLMTDAWWLMTDDCVHNPETPCSYNFEVHTLISIYFCELSMILLHKQVFFQSLKSQSLWIKFQPEQKIKPFLYSTSFWHYWTTVVLNKSTMTDIYDPFNSLKRQHFVSSNQTAFMIIICCYLFYYIHGMIKHCPGPAA